MEVIKKRPLEWCYCGVESCGGCVTGTLGPTGGCVAVRQPLNLLISAQLPGSLTEPTCAWLTENGFCLLAELLFGRLLGC